MSEECVKISSKSDRCVEMFDLLNQQRESGELCDIAIRAGGRKLNAHRLVLSSKSPFFRTMFGSRMKEAKAAEVNFPEINYDTMERIIGFIYTTQLTISIGTAQNLINAANFFQIGDLVQLCGNYIVKHIDATNCFSVRELLKMSNCEEEVIARANEYINANFLQIVHNKEFLELGIDEVMELLNSEVYCTSEDDVFHAAVRWLEARDEPKEYSEQILSCIRVSLLSKSFKEFHVTKNSLFKKKKQFNVSKVSRPQKTSLLVLRSLKNKNSLYTYESSTKKWVKMMNLEEANYTDIAASKGYIFTCRDDLELEMKIFEAYNRITKEWTKLLPTMKDQGSFDMVSVGSKLYVFKHWAGKDSQITVFDMNSKRKRGKKLKNVDADLSDGSVTVVEKYIYVSGEYLERNIKLDTDTDTLSDLDEDMYEKSSEPYTGYKGKLCALSTDEDAIVVYDEGNKEWKELVELPNEGVTDFISTTDGIYALKNLGAKHGRIHSIFMMVHERFGNVKKSFQPVLRIC